MAEITTARYSDEDLKIFENLLVGKLEKAYKQVENFQSRLIEMEESSEDDAGAHYMNDGNFSEQVAFLNSMIIRQKKHVGDLESALMRVKNKTYGRCMVTGELIDRNRLLAVPTTTKSIAGKQQLESGVLKEKKKVEVKATKPIITSRVIKKPLAVKPPIDSNLIDDSVDFIQLPDDDDEYEDDSYDTVEDNLSNEEGIWS